jgi:hypothetical protein
MSVIQTKLIGGYGNQLFQYACARKYAEMYGATLEVDNWFGIKAFGLYDPLITNYLPERTGSFGHKDAVTIGEVNIRLGGYFQHQDWVKLLSRKELKSWFKISPKWEAYLPKERGYVACHLREGDYIGHWAYCNITKESYTKALEQYGFNGNIEWVTMNNPTRNQMLDSEGLYDLYDFVKIMQADVILRANSTFSWWAAVLSNARVYSPVVDDLVGVNDVSFVEGNSPRCADTNRVGVPMSDLYLPE